MIQFNNVCVKFGKNTVLENISFSLNNGELIYILGPNGSGKTTLINVINKLVKHSSGSIKNDFLKTSTLFQKQVDNINFPATVFEILYSTKQYKEKRVAYTKKIDALLELMEIKKLKHKLIGELSGGELQRVMFIKTILPNPDLLILDEPTSAIDPNFREKFTQIINDINHTGTTIILITHDIAGLSPLCKNKVLFLDKQIKFYGSYCDYYNEHIIYKEHVHVSI